MTLNDIFGILLIPILAFVNYVCCKDGIRKIAYKWFYSLEFIRKYKWVCVLEITIFAAIISLPVTEKICQILIGIVSSILVALFLEHKNVYYACEQRDKLRIEYYQMLQEFVSHIRFSKGLKTVPAGEDVVQTVWRILPFLIVRIKSLYNEQRNLLDIEEIMICKDLIRRYNSIFTTIKESKIREIQLQGNILTCNKDKCDLVDYEDVAYRKARHEFGKSVFMRSYNIGLEVLEKARKIEYSLDGFENWDDQAMAVLISSDCYGINEGMNHLFNIALKWPEMHKMIKCK